MSNTTTSSDSDGEFFDAVESPTKSRAGSLKRGVVGPIITVTRHKDDDDDPVQSPPVVRSAPTLTFSAATPFDDLTSLSDKPSAFLPEEIAKELEELSKQDDDRAKRLARLERLHFGQEDIDEEQQDNEMSPQMESTESSVEAVGLHMDGGPSTSHPFRVVEPDTRSIQSDSRSVGSRFSVSRAVSEQRGTDDKKEEDPPSDGVTASSPMIPDIVSSVAVKNKNFTSSSSASSSTAAQHGPNRPPRRKKKTSTPSQYAPAPLISSPTEPVPAPRPPPDLSPIPHAPSPSSSCTALVASLTRDLEHSLHSYSLDLQTAAQGQFVVKPQDIDESRGGSDQPSLGLDERYTTAIERTVSCPVEDRDEGPNDPPNPSPERSGRVGSTGNRSFKSASGSGGRRSSGAGHGTAGHNSLGSNFHSTGGKRSAASGNSMDSKIERGEGVSKQMNLLLRTRSESGKRLSDTLEAEDILKQIKVKNLDTGEEMDLMEAEDQLPPTINPLSLHIMRLTSEYVSGDNPTSIDSDTESMISSVSGWTLGKKKKSSVMKKFFDDAVKKTRKTAESAKSMAVEATKKRPRDPKPPEKLGSLATEIKPNADRRGGPIFRRIQKHKSGPFDFENIQFAQELASQHLGPIWCMRFSQCGQLLATAGQDTILRIWVLKESYDFFNDMRTRYNAGDKNSPTNSYDNVVSDQNAPYMASSTDRDYHVFYERPFCTYQGHTSDLLDVSWSKNYFILTSSMDKTVRLWHISRRECLCCFQHIDFVTAIAFHPRNDQFFISGSLDGKIRLWNIPDKKVTLWNEVDGSCRLITAANFIQNGKFAVVGTYDGRCIFYSTDQLKYYTMIHVRSARGKNQGRKVTGIEPMPGEDKILVTSNDSRIRLYDLRDLSLSCKYKGYTNASSQIRASFSQDGKYITSGSENQCVYLWRTYRDSHNLTDRKDRNENYELIRAHNAVVTCSVFAPKPEKILEKLLQLDPPSSSKDVPSKDQPASNPHGYVLVSGDYDGDLKIFYNFAKAKHSSLPTSAIVS